MKRAKFEIYQTLARYGIGGPSVKEWRWRLVAGNGEIVASGEGYTRKADAIRAAARLAALAEQAAARQPMILKAAKAVNSTFVISATRLTQAQVSAVVGAQTTKHAASRSL